MAGRALGSRAANIEYARFLGSRSSNPEYGLSPGSTGTAPSFSSRRRSETQLPAGPCRLTEAEPALQRDPRRELRDRQDLVELQSNSVSIHPSNLAGDGLQVGKAKASVAAPLWGPSQLNPSSSRRDIGENGAVVPGPDAQHAGGTHRNVWNPGAT